MLARLLPAVICLAAVAPPSRGADTATDAGAPAVLVRLASIEELLNKAEYLASLSGQGDMPRQMISFARALSGEKGIEGVDVKHPFAVYARVMPEAQKSPVVALIPIADKDSFLALLKGRLQLDVKEDKPGLYRVAVPNAPVPVYFRFSGKYLYVTALDPANIDEGSLGNAEKIVGEPRGLLEVRVRLDRIPEQFKKLGLGQAEMQTAQAKQQPLPGETPAQTALKEAVIDSAVGGLKSVLTDGREFALRVTVDPKADEVGLEWELSGKPGSPLAEQFARLKERLALAGAWPAKGSAFRGLLHLGLPASVVKPLGPVVDEAVKELPDRAPPEARAIAATLFKALAPTLKTGELDGGVRLIGPDKDGRYTTVLAGRVAKGADIEAAVKEVVKALPGEAQNYFELDADKVDGTALHAVKVSNFMDERGRALFGDGPVLIGFRDDRAVFTFGPEAKSAAGEALKAAPGAGPIGLADWAVARLAPIMNPMRAEAAKATAEHIFGKDVSGDSMRARLDGGDSLRMRVSLSGKAIKFFGAMQSDDGAKKE